MLWSLLDSCCLPFSSHSLCRLDRIRRPSPDTEDLPRRRVDNKTPVTVSVTKTFTWMNKRPRSEAGSATEQGVPESEQDIADVFVDDDEASDGDVDDEELESLHQSIDATGIVRSAALGRVCPHTREAYNLHLRQCAVWAQSNAQFKDEVVSTGADVHMKWPLNEAVVVGFVDHLQQKQVPWHHTQKTKRLAPSSLAHVFSAFRDLYSVHAQAVPQSLDIYFKNSYRQYTLFISQQKLDGLYPDTINSVGFSVSTYKQICDKLVGYWTSGRGSCNSAVRHLRTFFIFCFCLLGRAERIGRLRFQWMSWTDDCLLVKIPTTKSDQAGAMSYFKRIYANALNPTVCPILALAIEVFSRASSDGDPDRVFPGSLPHAVHNIGFKSFLRKTFGLTGLGIDTARVTGHSPKRSAIMTVSDCEVIQWHSAELRADHKCGITSSYQTSPAPQQDGIMGRLLSCLPFGERDFNVAPPHFDAKDIASVPFSKMVTNFETYTTDFKSVIPFLFASLVHHWEWIERNLPQSHPIFTSKFAVLYNRNISSWRSVVLGGSVGARSLLKVTGNSSLCDMHITCNETALKVDDIHAMLRNGRSLHATCADAGVAHATQSLIDLNDSIQVLIRQNSELLKRQCTAPNAPAPHAVGQRQTPVFYLNQSWRLPNGIQPEGLFYKWFVPDGNVPAYKDISNQMLPESSLRRSQETLLSKFRTLMKCLVGSTPSHWITRDVTTAFVLCWKRLQCMCEFPDSTVNDAAITVYGKIPTATRTQLQSKPVEGFKNNEFIQAATLAVHAAAALQTTSADGTLGQHADVFFQAASEALREAVDAEESTFHVAECGVSTAEGTTAPKCIPRGARLYPSEAPRPPVEADVRSTSSATSIRAGGAYVSYVRDNAPRAGAEACWACPYCLSSSSRGAFQANAHSLRRHVRERHSSDYNASDIGDYLYRSLLVWCSKDKNVWSPIFGDDVMRIVSSYRSAVQQ